MHIPSSYLYVFRVSDDVLASSERDLPTNLFSRRNRVCVTGVVLGLTICLWCLVLLNSGRFDLLDAKRSAKLVTPQDPDTRIVVLYPSGLPVFLLLPPQQPFTPAFSMFDLKCFHFMFFLVLYFSISLSYDASGGVVIVVMRNSWLLVCCACTPHPHAPIIIRSSHILFYFSNPGIKSSEAPQLTIESPKPSAEIRVLRRRHRYPQNRQR